MTTITRAELSALGRRREQPAKQPGEFLAIFVRGRLVNTKNARLHWKSEMKYKQVWRGRVLDALLLLAGSAKYPWPFKATDHKRVTLHAIVPSRFDSQDGLRVACAPIVDAMKVSRGREIGAGILDDDRDSSGHVFEYTQEAKRAKDTVYGVRIGVSLR